MPSHSDNGYPLQPDHSFTLQLQADGWVDLPDVRLEAGTWLLAARCHASCQEPSIQLRSSSGKELTQYFERDCNGLRYLNLSGLLEAGSRLQLIGDGCRIAPELTLLGFAAPAFADGPLLIVAPHADDAELAAYGLYKHHAANSWIVTVSAGERLQSLKKQYIPQLDTSMADAERRKGVIRAWNSATTPWLAGVAPERLVMLGYFNMTLKSMLATPEENIPHPKGMPFSPADFRCFNRMALASDAHVRNSGEMLMADLVQLINTIRPATILVTHPELDPHDDHLATSQAVAQALSRTDFRPQQVLLYANHYRDSKGFPYGPEHAATTLPPAHMPVSLLGKWKVHSECLSLAEQKEKVVALDTMHDLRHKLRLERRLKQWFAQLWRRYRHRPGYHYYAAHPYFQTAIKAHEVFVVIEGDAFVDGMLQAYPAASRHG